MKRLYILGTMGSGKTTLAKKFLRLKIKYDLDDIYWKKFDIRRDEKEVASSKEADQEKNMDH